MKNKLKMKNRIIIVLCITIIMMGIGFCIVSMNLNEYTSKKQFDVSIRTVIPGTITKGGIKEPISSYKLENNNKTVDFYYELENMNDSVTYTVIIKNKGTIDAKIDNIIFSNNSNSNDIEIKNNNLKNEILRSGEEEELNIEVSINKNQKNSFNILVSILSSSINE